MKRYAPMLMIAALLLPALVFVGCSDDSGTSPTDDGLTSSTYEAVAEDYSSTLASEDEGMLEDWGSFDTGTTTTLSKGFATLADTASRYRRGLDVTVIRTYYDAAGNEYDRYDPDTTIAMQRELTITGTIGHPDGRRTATVDHQGQMYVEGLAPQDTIRTLNGAGQRHVESSFQSRFETVSRNMVADYQWTVTDLVWHKDRETHPYPLSGTVDVTALVIRDITNPDTSRSDTVEVDMTVTFDGTEVAELEIPAAGIGFFVGLGSSSEVQSGACYRENPRGMGGGMGGGMMGGGM